MAIIELGMKKERMIRIMLALAVILAFSIWRSVGSEAEKIHYHAGFNVFINGDLQDFGRLKYMHDIPCTAQKIKVKEDPQIEKAHLHDLVSDVVHVHREGAVWGDLFVNMNYLFPPEATVSGYIAGATVSGILSYPIKPDDSVIFVVGDPALVNINDYVSIERIRQIEQGSESCGDRS